MTRVENNKVTAYAPFAEGWLRGARPSRGSTTFGDAWKARRVLVMPDGALLVSEDEAGVIYRISYTSR